MLRAIRITVLTLMVLAGASAPAFAAAVAVSVNDTPITSAQIVARANLIKLEHRGHSTAERRKLATDELIDEAIKLQQAQKLGISVTDAQVNDAYLNVARNLRVSADKLNLILTSNGVSPETLKARLRSSIAWSQVTRQAVAPTVQFSDLKLDEQAKKELDQTNSYDYLLKEVLFVIPHNSNIPASRRTAQANRYRKDFSGCDSAVKLSLAYTDVAVRDIGRRHATQLPDPVAKELASLPVGGISKPRVVNGGVSMLAICSKEQARDVTFLKQKLRNKTGTQKLQSKADEYLQKLKDQASIVYH